MDLLRGMSVDVRVGRVRWLGEAVGERGGGERARVDSGGEDW